MVINSLNIGFVVSGSLALWLLLVSMKAFSGPLTPYIAQADMPETKARTTVNALAVDSQNRIWLTLMGRHSLGMVRAGACATRRDCEPDEFPLPDIDARPRFVTVDTQGDVWVTVQRPGDTGLIYRFDPDTETFIDYEARGEDPFDITTDSRGIIWFTDFTGGTINSINTRTRRTVVEYQAPEGDCRGIAVDRNDVVWATCGTTLVRYHRNAFRILENVYAIPKASKPFGVVPDADGMIWILDQHQGPTLYRFDERSATFDNWRVPSLPDNDPIAPGTTVDPHWLVKRGNTIYYTGFTGVVGTFNVIRETFGTYVISPSRQNGGSGAYDIAVDRVGRVWFTEVLANKLSRAVFPQLPNPRPLPRP